MKTKVSFHKTTMQAFGAVAASKKTRVWTKQATQNSAQIKVIAL